MNFNLEFHNGFEQLFYRVESIGPSISILAWMSVFFATVVFGFSKITMTLLTGLNPEVKIYAVKRITGRIKEI